MLAVFSPIFAADTKMICGYNLVAPFKVSDFKKMCQLKRFTIISINFTLKPSAK